MRRTLAPTLPPEDQRAPNPVAEQRERQKAAIASRLEGHEHAQRGGSGGAAPLPKPAAPTTRPKPEAASATAAASAPAGATSAPSPAPKKSEPSEKTRTDTAGQSSTPSPAAADSPQPESGSAAPAASVPAPLSFTPKAFKKWAQENPEEALRFREDIDRDTFRMGEDPKQEWIRQTTRSRKMKEQERERTAQAEERLAAREKAASEQLQLAETTAQSLRYMSEMWGAANGKDVSGNRVIDFDQVDEAFKQNTGGMSVDEYIRARARRGVANPEAARLRSELRRAELELQKHNAGTAGGGRGTLPAPAQTNGAAASSTEAPAAPAPAVAAPAASNGLHTNPEEYWEETLSSDHPLRKLAGWGPLLDRAMLQWQDDDDEHSYSRDADEIATELFQRQLAALQGGGEKPADKVPVKPHARSKPGPKTPKGRTPAIRREAVSEDAPPTNVAGVGIPAGKLVPRGQVNTDRSHYEVPKEKWGDLARQGTGENIRRSAIERARMRAQGIDPDTGGAWEG